MCLKRITNMIIETMGRRRATSYTSALLHMEGTDVSRDFIDETGKIWTNVGEWIYLFTGYKKFGISSLACLSSSYITTPYNSYFNLINSDFTIDFWMRDYDNKGTDREIFSKGYHSSASNEFIFYSRVYNQSNRSQFLVYDSNGTTSYSFFSSIDTNSKYPNFYHVAVVRYSDIITIYIDGVSGGSMNVSGYILANYGSNVDIGYDNTASAFVDEFRISNIARWTSNFTPPTSAYTLD